MMNTTQEPFVYKTTPHCDIHLEVYRRTSVPEPTPVNPHAPYVWKTVKAFLRKHLA